jgi:hypothetical protein
VSDQSTALAVPDEILNPLTGEMVRTSDMPAVARVLQELRHHRQQVSNLISDFTQAVVVESQLQGKKTLEADGLKIEIRGGSEVEWDIETLLELHALGLPEARYRELVTEVVSYKVNGSVARQIAGARPEYAAVIERAKRQVPKPYSAAVK